MIIINIKPLSVNEAWQGKRFKTKKYKEFEAATLLLLPKLNIPQPPFEITINFGLSSKLADIDNGLKPTIDILQKKYGFNDRDVYKLVVEKTIVQKSKEFIKFTINTIK